MSLAAVVFDFDGLILDTETALFETTAAVFAEHGVPIERAWWVAEIVGMVDHPHWTELLQEGLGRPLPDLEAVAAARNERYHARIAMEAVRPGVLALLDEATAAGVPCAVASSSPRDWVEGNLERLGLLPRFAAVRSRDDVAPGRAKPAPDLYLAACDAVGAPPAAAVALEDTPTGLAAARAAGMAVVGVPAGLSAGLAFDGADLVVESLATISLEDLRRLVG